MTNEANPFADDLLVGAAAIRSYLNLLGMPHVDIYHMRRHGLWPIGKAASGGSGRLVASKRRLNQHIDALTRGNNDQQDSK